MVANIQSWADNLDIIWIPDVDEDISNLQGQQAELNAAVSSLAQTLGDQLSAHQVTLSVLQTLVQAANANAIDAAILAGNAGQQAYIDQRISDLEEQLALSLASAQTVIEANVTATSNTYLEGISPALTANIAAAMANIDAKIAELSVKSDEVDAATQSVLDVTLPMVTSIQEDALNRILAMQSDYDALVLDFPSADLMTHFDEVRTELNTSIDGVSSNLATNYMTGSSVNAAVAAANETLKSSMESPTGSIGQLSANLTNNYYTKTTVDSAIASSATTLSAATSAKGKTIYSSTAPAAEDRLTQNLWIDTANGANTPKRWNGSAWVGVTDKVATDAADSAATANSNLTSLGSTVTSILGARADLLTGTAFAGLMNQLQVSTSTGNSGWVTNQASAMTQLNSTVVQMGNDLNARIDDNDAAITSLMTATADAEQAIASIDQTLSATANAGTAYFRDTFDGDLSLWEVLRDATSGDGEVAAIASSTGIGPKVLRLGNNSGNDTVWMAHRHLIPFDPNKLYKMTIRARRVSGTGVVYAGFLGVAADGVTLVDRNGLSGWNAYYHAAAGVAFGASFEDRSGYTKGRLSVGVAGVGTVSNPSEVHTNVSFLRPLIIANHNAVAGVHEIAHVTVDDGSIADLPATVETQAAVISGLTDTAMYSIRVATSGGESKMELVSSSNPSGPATAINLVSDNILLRASNVVISNSSNLYPDYDMEDDNFYYTSSSANYQFLTAQSSSVGRRYISISPSVATDNELVYTKWFRVEPSTEYLIRGGSWMSATGAGLGTAALYFQTGSDDGSGNITMIAQTLLRSVGDTGFSGASLTENTLLTPANCRAVRFLMYRPAGGTGHARFGGFGLKQKINSSLVVDGEILGRHIGANEVTADKMAVTDLSAVSAVIGILRTATSGARMEVRTDKILVYDASGVVRVKIGNLA